MLKFKPGTASTLPITLMLVGCSGYSSDDISTAQEQCVDFYQNERASAGATVEALDHWTKDGKLVIQLGERESQWDDSYGVSYCVYDKEDGSLNLPSLINMGQWAK